MVGYLGYLQLLPESVMTQYCIALQEKRFLFLLDKSNIYS